MEKLSTGCYRETYNGHVIEVWREGREAGADYGLWSFTIDGDWPAEPWPTKREARECARKSIDANGAGR